MICQKCKEQMELYSQENKSENGVHIKRIIWRCECGETKTEYFTGGQGYGV